MLPLARRYIFPVKFVVPSFLFTQFIAAFLRNDGNPGLATKAVLFGGIFQCIWRLFLCFCFKNGNYGSRTCDCYGFCIFITHNADTFSKQKKYPLKFVKPEKLFCALKSICVTGFSTFFIDVAMGILTMLFNRQILKIFGYGCAVRLRYYYQYQHVCSVLCI